MLKRNWYDVAWELTRDDGHVVSTSVRHVFACDATEALLMLNNWYSQGISTYGSLNVLGSTYTYEHIRVIGLTDLRGQPYPTTNILDLLHDQNGFYCGHSYGGAYG